MAVSRPMDAAGGGGYAQSLVEEEAPMFSSDFANAAWEVYLAKGVVNTLMAHTDRAAVRALMAQLARLAAGPHDSGSTKLHGSAVDGMIIVWDIAIQFSLREQIYTHGVRVHSLTDKKGLKQSAASVKDSISQGRQSTLRKMTAAGEYSPCCEITGSTRNIARQYLLTDVMARFMNSPRRTGAEFPFCPAEDEADLHMQEGDASILLLGRSGTGKTTFIVRKMHDEWLDALVQGSDHNQLFLSRNPVLVKHVQQSFKRMQAAVVAPPTDDADAAGGDPSVRFENTHQFLQAADGTTRTPFLVDGRTLDAGASSLQAHQTAQRLIARRSEIEEQLALRPSEELKKNLQIVEDQLRDAYAAGADRSLRTKRKSKKGKDRPSHHVSYEFFRSQMWPRLGHPPGCGTGASARVSASAVFSEIVSYIRGSSLAVDTPSGELSQDQYLSLPTKLAPTFRPDSPASDGLSRLAMYRTFEKYKKLQRELNAWDSAQLVHSIYTQVKAHGWTGAPIDSLLVDEVQDFTQAELRLLMLIVPKNKMVLAGDTAQTISRVGFRFQDLRSMFHDFAQAELEAGTPPKSRTVVPDVSQLRVNFRSHDGILCAANAVIGTLMDIFPEAVDRLQPEKGVFGGPKPQLIGDRETHMLSRFVRASMGMSGPMDFGANVAIIVRSAAAKLTLPAEFREALVLTVQESKGLEFNDVLIYNFAADSDLTVGQWATILKDDELDVSQSRLGHRSNKVLRRQVSERAELQPLCEDLKFFYVALTRARRRVIIFDDSDKRMPPFEMLGRRGLANAAHVEGLSVQSLTGKPRPQGPPRCLPQGAPRAAGLLSSYGYG